MFVGEDKATQYGGKDKYLADKLPKLYADSGMNAEKVHSVQQNPRVCHYLWLRHQRWRRWLQRPVRPHEGWRKRRPV